MDLIPDDRLERSSVVANCAMNRERGLTGSNGYGRELGWDVVPMLRERSARTDEPARWLDLCCGSGRALLEAAEQLGTAAPVEILGLDLVDHFAPLPQPNTVVRLRTGSVTTWSPPDGQRFDTITCVHGLHYVGDKLAVLSRVAAWLKPDGVFTASFDAASVRRSDGSPLGRSLTSALRRAGFAYDARNRRISRPGGGAAALPFIYLGADDAAGPNYTGQPAVHSYYDVRPADRG